MTKKNKLQISKPISIWNRALKTDFKEFFKSLSKALAQGALQNWGEFAKNSLDALSALDLQKDLGQIVWLLIHRALVSGMYNLVQDNLELIKSAPRSLWNIREDGELSPQELETLCGAFSRELERKQLTINEEFFNHPQALSVLDDVKKPLVNWLIGVGLNESQAISISSRLPTYFVYALNEEWLDRPSEYAALKKALDTPFTRATERENSWSRYSALLQKQVDEPLFAEAFSLRQVYIPLRAFYQRKIDGKRTELLRTMLGERIDGEWVIVDLWRALERWLERDDTDDNMRIISGGPGCGKSSFAKMFAASQAEQGTRRVLFVPLYNFELADDLVSALDEFLALDGFISTNPLKESDPLLIIFDGLDELAMQGKLAADIAQQFVREVQRYVDRLNSRSARLKVLLTGRELAIQANASQFRRPQEILHVLPYHVSDVEVRQEQVTVPGGKGAGSWETVDLCFTKLAKGPFNDPERKLSDDQRHDWWRIYGKINGQGYQSLPKEMDRTDLQDITSQPLLNYLVALSFVRGQLDFSRATTVNEIYYDLLKAVYQRVWADHPHPSTEGVSEDEFILLLEEIAIATWHGDGRTTTLREVEMYCKKTGITPLLGRFKEGAKEGISRILIAFYFKKAGSRVSGEDTFEFTHKSFAEYLIARRIVRAVQHMQEELDRRENSYHSGWDERDALSHWTNLCGPVAVDGYLISYLRTELKTSSVSEVERWQLMLSRLVMWVIRNGMPIERLDPRPPYNDEVRQARNAEEALVATLNACALRTERLSEMAWVTSTSLGEQISRLEGQRRGSETPLILTCLSLITMNKCILNHRDLYSADLSKSDLSEAQFVRANLGKANLYRANLQGANLEGAIFEEADLQWTNLEKAKLTYTKMAKAQLIGSVLKGTIITDVDLREADLSRTDLQGAELRHVDLSGANLVEASFHSAKLDHVTFARAKLEKAKLTGAKLVAIDLRKADLHLASLYGAELRNADLGGASLKGANLQRADLSGANLEGVVLEGAQMQYANCRGTKLRGSNLRHANLDAADFSNADLRDCDLQGSTMLSCNFSQADLTEAEINLKKAIQQGAIFDGTVGL